MLFLLYSPTVLWLIKIGLIILIIQLAIGGVLFWYHGAFKKRKSTLKKFPSFRILFRESRFHSSEAGNKIQELKAELGEKFNSDNSKFFSIFGDYFQILDDIFEMRNLVGVILEEENKFKDKKSEKEFCSKYSLRTAKIQSVRKFLI